jgi:hypothetical protein
MTLLFRIVSILLLLVGIAAGIWGVLESHWLYLTLFGVLATCSTFLFILTHPVSQEGH